MQVFKTTLLLTLMTVFFLAVGGWWGGQTGMLLALLLAVTMNFTAYFFSDRLALAAYAARPVSEAELPRLYQILRNLTGREGLPMPRVFVIPLETPNAFATGRNPQHASVAVTEGILNLLDDEELEGVLGHELGHVRNRDILISSVAATLAGAIMILARIAGWGALFAGGREDREGGGLEALFLMIFAPLAAMLIQMAISRSREYAADASGAHWTGNPLALARALRKLEGWNRQRPMLATPSTAHLFIIQPRTRALLANLFSTHPPIDRRIERLERLAAQPPLA